MDLQPQSKRPGSRAETPSLSSPTMGLSSLLQAQVWFLAHPLLALAGSFTSHWKQEGTRPFHPFIESEAFKVGKNHRKDISPVVLKSRNTFPTELAPALGALPTWSVPFHFPEASCQNTWALWSYPVRSPSQKQVRGGDVTPLTIRPASGKGHCRTQA